MTDLEVKRGYVVLPDNRVKFGIRVINTEDFAISEVEVILDYSRSLFELEGNMVEALDTIPPSIPRTAVFLLKPLGCVHKEEIGATVRYRDHKWEKHTLDVRSKEVHCVCPFLKEKSITRFDFLKFSDEGYSAEQGVNFENISLEKLIEFLSHTCKNRLYKVDEFSIENGKVLYLAGDSLGEKAYYLLTVVVIEREETVQVLLHASSDKAFGLQGFLNEILENLRHLVQSVRAAREIGYIKNEQVINIIDSVVQHTNFTGGTDSPSVNIQDSVVQRTNFVSPEGQNREKASEEDLRKQQEDERLRKDAEENLRKQQEKEERLKKEKEEQEKKEQEKKEQEKKEQEKKEQEKKEQEKAIKEKAPETLKIPSADQTFPNPLKEKGASPRKMILIFGSIICLLAFIGWAMTDELPETYTNSIGIKFVLIPEGEFMMGSPEDEEGHWTDEGPVHKVTIKEPFYLGKYEVTQEQWREVMGNNPSYYKGDNLPVEQVSWNDAQKFIKKLNEMEGSDKYRLPSEAEWEYADRAGTGTSYFFGENSSELEEYAWYGEGWDSGSTHPVGLKKPNSWGLYDNGNVWEWTQDEYHESYEFAPSDGRVWENANASLRVFRGGSWFSQSRDCRSAARYRLGPDVYSLDLGFRLLRNP